MELFDTTLAILVGGMAFFLSSSLQRLIRACDEKSSEPLQESLGERIIQVHPRKHGIV